MEIEKLTKDDFDQILSELPKFWGERHSSLRPVHHPVYLYEFGDTAYVIREGRSVVAYPTGYVHLIGVRDSHRRIGLARELRRRGCTKIKAITRPENLGSIDNYRAPGEHRVVFEMEI